MKILCYVHTELPWENDMSDAFHFAVAQAYFNQKWDHIYAFVSEIGTSNDGMAQDLIPFVNHLVDAGYCKYEYWSWNEEPYEEDESGYIEVSPSFHTDDYPYFTRVPEVVMDWTPEDEIVLVGGGRDACLEEFECILDHFRLNYRVWASY